MSALTASAQENEGYRYPDEGKMIPDKVFEIGAPLLLLWFIINTIVNIFKIKSEARLKEKALDKGISEATLIELFREDKKIIRSNYLKWFLVLCALGIALIYIHLLGQYKIMASGYLSLGLISFFVSIALFIYYRLSRKHF